MSTLKPYKGDYYLWEYIPSIGASVVFLLFFLAATCYHSWKIWQTKARFCIAFCIGGIFELIGYIARAVCYNNTADLIPYCIQSVFILLGPVLFAASVYMALGKVIRSTGGEKYSLIRVQWLTKTFVASDIVSFLVQGTGSGMMAMGGSMAGTAKGITIAGLVIQLLMFSLFIFTSIAFERRMDRFSYGESSPSWKRHLYSLYAISALIMIRSVFRVIEYAMGQKGYLLSHEWTMYIFDSLLMLGVMVIWAFWHPGSLHGGVRPDSGMLPMQEFEEK
ncbi:hypothetical protein PENSTE_c017G07645 [Penicillium steckii]|uniref:RTA1 domain protein n=1 Tax=Penicillium steckii TaxID=303698 RepID=A0A1V6SYE4_9EURO|nr:hypothetical protein PENSTE_c017G07645 [Penicillium steckii]